MSGGAFPFRAARPKGAPKPPTMSFDLPAPPPAVEEPKPPEIPFSEEPEQSAELNQTVEEDMAKAKKRGRPATKKVTEGPKAARFTFAEVLSVIGESEPVLKVVAKITPVIEILKPDDRRRVVDILSRLYG